MPVVMKMKWDGVTPEQYDDAREKVRWEQEPAEGGLHHVAWFENGALMVIDVWETAEDFQRFVDQRLMPGVEAIGIPGQPEVDIQPVHAVFDPPHA